MENSIYVIFGEGGIHAIKHIFSQKASTNHMKSFLVTRNSVTMKDSVCLDMGWYKNWAHKTDSWKCLNIWRPCPAGYSQSLECLISALHPDSFWGCWTSAAAAAHDLTLVEVDMEKEMATHSSILAWRIPWTEEPGGLLSMGSHRVGHDWRDLSCMHALKKEMATHSSIRAWRIPWTEEPGGLPSWDRTESDMTEET